MRHAVPVALAVLLAFLLSPPSAAGERDSLEVMVSTGFRPGVEFQGEQVDGTARAIELDLDSAYTFGVALAWGQPSRILYELSYRRNNADVPGIDPENGERFAVDHAINEWMVGVFRQFGRPHDPRPFVGVELGLSQMTHESIEIWRPTVGFSFGARARLQDGWALMGRVLGRVVTLDDSQTLFCQPGDPDCYRVANGYYGQLEFSIGVGRVL